MRAIPSGNLQCRFALPRPRLVAPAPERPGSPFRTLNGRQSRRRRRRLVEVVFTNDRVGSEHERSVKTKDRGREPCVPEEPAGLQAAVCFVAFIVEE
jgi:hypothetical protein